MVTMSGTTSQCSMANQVPVRPDAGLDLVGDEQDAVVLTDLLDLAHVLRRRDDEAALSLHRLGDHGGHVFRGYLFVEGVPSSSRIRTRRRGGSEPSGQR